MGKRKLLIIIATLVLAVLLVAILKYQSTKQIDTKLLKGDIILVNPIRNDKREVEGLIKLDPREVKLTKLNDSIFFMDPVYSDKKDKILFISRDENIAEFDLKNKKTNVIAGYGYKEAYDYAKYVPSKVNEVSYTRGNKIYIYDLITKKATYLIDHIGDYCWNKDGSALLYENEGIIYKYDLLQKRSSKFLDGYSPIYSYDNNYIAYIKHSDALTVRELASGDEWSFNGRGIKYYKFSPDNKYLAIEQEGGSIKYLYGQELKIWDFRTGAACNLIKHIDDGACGDFDWK